MGREGRGGGEGRGGEGGKGGEERVWLYGISESNDGS